jgi:hypothetical protein
MSNEGLFHDIADEFVVLVNRRGVYRQAKLYRRDKGLYAGASGGFIRLLTEGGTSVPDIRWEGLTLAHRVGRLGRLEVA